MCTTHVNAKISLKRIHTHTHSHTQSHTHTTQILSWTRWILTELWRSSHLVSAGASGPPWSPTDPGAGTAVEGVSPSRPPPWHPRHTTPQTDPTGWWRRPLPRRRTHSSPRGSTPRTWWERCAAWSSPQAARSTGTGGTRALRCGEDWVINLSIFSFLTSCNKKLARSRIVF